MSYLPQWWGQEQPTKDWPKRPSAGPTTFMPYGAGPAPGSVPIPTTQGFTPAPPEFMRQTTDAHRRREEAALMAEMTGESVSKGVSNALAARPIKVEIVGTRSDPMGGQSSGYFPYGGPE